MEIHLTFLLMIVFTYVSVGDVSCKLRADLDCNGLSQKKLNMCKISLDYIQNFTYELCNCIVRLFNSVRMVHIWCEVCHKPFLLQDIYSYSNFSGGICDMDILLALLSHPFMGQITLCPSYDLVYEYLMWGLSGTLFTSRYLFLFKLLRWYLWYGHSACSIISPIYGVDNPLSLIWSCIWVFSWYCSKVNCFFSGLGNTATL